MIGYLSGTIKFKESTGIIVDVNGVGYRVFVPTFVLDSCQLGQKKEFLVYTHVRDNELSLYGFLNLADKEMFTYLISVSGIGPKLALNIFSYAQGANRILRAIQEANVDFFSSVKGVGKKSSQRIIVDLKSKLGGLKELEFETEQDQDLLTALRGLGFSREEIKLATKGVKKDLSLEEKIRLALKKVNEGQK